MTFGESSSKGELGSSYLEVTSSELNNYVLKSFASFAPKILQTMFRLTCSTDLIGILNGDNVFSSSSVCVWISSFLFTLIA